MHGKQFLVAASRCAPGHHADTQSTLFQALLREVDDVVHLFGGRDIVRPLRQTEIGKESRRFRLRRQRQILQRRHARDAP